MILQFTNPRTGQLEEHELRSDLLFGRKTADIVVADPKISSKHAKIIQEGDKLFIVDQGSTNKIVYQGNRVDKLELFPGTQFHLGSVLFDVLDDGATPSKSAPSSEQDQAQHWSELIKQSLKELLEVAKQKEKEIYPFSKELYLKNLSGPAKGKHYELLYGPRSLGNLNQDLCLYDWNIGDASFEIVEHDKDIYLTTDDVGRVFVNAKSEAIVKLETGDKINIGQTELLVEVKSNE